MWPYRASLFEILHILDSEHKKALVSKIGLLNVFSFLPLKKTNASLLIILSMTAWQLSLNQSSHILYWGNVMRKIWFNLRLSVIVRGTKKINLRCNLSGTANPWLRTQWQSWVKPPSRAGVNDCTCFTASSLCLTCFSAVECAATSCSLLPRSSQSWGYCCLWARGQQPHGLLSGKKKDLHEMLWKY